MFQSISKPCLSDLYVVFSISIGSYSHTNESNVRFSFYPLFHLMPGTKGE